jgi:putative methyltransferase (TIGR04325 family)
MAGVSSVLDFGGGCGRHYKEARSPTVRWAVVESAAMVERAKELATDRLQFFTSISDAVNWLGPIDVMHSNGALQFASDPQETLRQLCGLGAKKLIWQRLVLSGGDEPERVIFSSFLGDNGPGSIRIKEKNVQYEQTKIPERTFLDAHKGYSLAERGSDWFQFLSQQTR